METVPEPTPASADAILLESVSKQFVSGGRTVHALDAITARVRKGGVTGIVGPDGAGKTTLMRLIVGLLIPDRGRINVLGIEATADPLAVQRCVGYMPQRFGLYEDLTVQENLDLYADLQGVSSAERPARYTELLRMTALGPFTGRLARRLSGGMKQKLGLACTLIGAPQLLLLDEPTVGVDPVSRRELWAIVFELVRSRHTTVLLSTAYLDEAERCDEVILLHGGKLIGRGRPARFTQRMTGHSYRVTAPALNKRALRERLESAPGVLDAIIQGEGVRIVTRHATSRGPGELLPDVPNVEIHPVKPRFEDCFVSLLKTLVPAASRPAIATQPARLTLEHEHPIAVSHLSRQFSDFYAVRDITFEVKRGEIFGLLGANGAGKSTTFRMLCGLLPPSAGTLHVAGVDLRRAAARARARIGYMAQKFSLYGELSVLQNMRFFSSAYGLSGSRQRERIQWALKEFELDSFSNVSSRDLPLGYKQRLALAVALMHEPEILFLDEPTSGVDPLARREFWRRINNLAESGVTVMVTTHFMEEAEYCDRLVIMAQGRILAEGTSDEMKARLRSPENPDPTIEDAFVALIQASQGNGAVS
jgi:ABC-2 type transport system ATP-binding protein